MNPEMTPSLVAREHTTTLITRALWRAREKWITLGQHRGVPPQLVLASRGAGKSRGLLTFLAELGDISDTLTGEDRGKLGFRHIVAIVLDHYEASYHMQELGRRYTDLNGVDIHPNPASNSTRGLLYRGKSHELRVLSATHSDIVSMLRGTQVGEVYVDEPLLIPCAVLRRLRDAYPVVAGVSSVGVAGLTVTMPEEW